MRRSRSCARRRCSPNRVSKSPQRSFRGAPTDRRFAPSREVRTRNPAALIFFAVPGFRIAAGAASGMTKEVFQLLLALAWFSWNQPSSCADLIRASIILERKMDCRVQRRAEATPFFVLRRGERKRRRSSFFAQASGSDAVLRTAMPGNDASWRFHQNMKRYSLVPMRGTASRIGRPRIAGRRSRQVLRLLLSRPPTARINQLGWYLIH